jgi:hypothetical protein
LWQLDQWGNGLLVLGGLLGRRLEWFQSQWSCFDEASHGFNPENVTYFDAV